jgi:F0F1-type ATP synthase assembly protein I
LSRVICGETWVKEVCGKELRERNEKFENNSLNMLVKYHRAWLELVLLGIIAFGTMFFKGLPGLVSVILGGSCWFVPSQYFFQKLKKVPKTADNKKLLEIFFVSETIKLVSSIGLMVFILLIYKIDRLSFLGGYVFMIVTSFLLSLKSGVKK